jgi:toxin YoeB
VSKKGNRSSDRESVISSKFRDDLRYWAETERRTLVKIFDLMEAICRDPFSGIGKPEPLKHKGAGMWSRRITQGHRLTYAVSEERIEFLQARYYY